MAALPVNVPGYRPLVTRRIGSAPKSSLKPIDLVQIAPKASADDELQPPAHGFSNWEAYDADEVILADHSACTAEDQPFTLHAPRPLAGECDLHVLFIAYDTPTALRLPQPSEVHADGRSYTFTGCYLISQYAVTIPPLHFLAGEGVCRATFTPVATPPTWAGSRGEREALEKLQRVM